MSERDKTTLQGDETCIACPTEVRNLYATAHNAVSAIERAIQGSGSWERAHRMVTELKSAVETMKPIVERHFENPQPVLIAAGERARLICRHVSTNPGGFSG